MNAPQIGDIRYEVFGRAASGSEPPWISRMRLEGFSPAGRKVRWRALRVAGRPLITYDASDPPSATPDEAVTRFQRAQAKYCFFEPDEGVDRRVRLILVAEALRVKACTVNSEDHPS